MRAAEALNRTFAPRKMNFSCYGNAEPHVHWHLVPRYDDDPHPGQDPWRDVGPLQREDDLSGGGGDPRGADPQSSRVVR